MKNGCLEKKKSGDKGSSRKKKDDTRRTYNVVGRGILDLFLVMHNPDLRNKCHRLQIGRKRPQHLMKGKYYHESSECQKMGPKLVCDFSKKNRIGVMNSETGETKTHVDPFVAGDVWIEKKSDNSTDTHHDKPIHSVVGVRVGGLREKKENWLHKKTEKCSNFVFAQHPKHDDCCQQQSEELDESVHIIFLIENFEHHSGCVHNNKELLRDQREACEKEKVKERNKIHITLNVLLFLNLLQQKHHSESSEDLSQKGNEVKQIMREKVVGEERQGRHGTEKLLSEIVGALISEEKTEGKSSRVGLGPSNPSKK